MIVLTLSSYQVKISDLKDRARNLITKKESSTSPEKIVMPSKSAVSSPSSKSPSSQRFTMKIVTKGSLSLAGTTTTTKKTAPTIGSSGGDVPAAKAAKAVRESTPDIVELTNNETIASSVTGNNTTGQTVVKTEEERKEDLRQRARLLIAAARKGQVSKDSVKVATSKSAAKVDVKENTHTSKLSLMSEGKSTPPLSSRCELLFMLFHITLFRFKIKNPVLPVQRFLTFTHTLRLLFLTCDFTRVCVCVCVIHVVTHHHYYYQYTHNNNYNGSCNHYHSC